MKHENIISCHEGNVFWKLEDYHLQNTSTFKTVRGKWLRWKDLKGL